MHRSRSEKVSFQVALLAEGVDRNADTDYANVALVQSPSSRRAWIEIQRWYGQRPPFQSPSSRRAWIEMRSVTPTRGWVVVALLAEGVDRNVSRKARRDRDF